MIPIQNMINQKRESFRFNIRKLQNEDYFNSKRFLISPNPTLSLESEIQQNDIDFPYLMENFHKMLANEFSKLNFSLNYVEFDAFGDFLKKAGLLVEKRQWFHAEAIELLLNYGFKYNDILNTKTLLDFCLFIEKLMIYCANHLETIITMNLIEKMKELLQSHRKSHEILESIFFSYSCISSNFKLIDRLIKNDIILEILITMMSDSCEIRLVRCISLLIYNITTIPKDEGRYYKFMKFLLTICAQMLELKDKDIVCCSLASIYGILGEDDKEHEVFMKRLDDFCFNKDFLILEKTHILEIVSKCLLVNDEEIKKGALRIIYKVSLGTEKHINLLMQFEIVDMIIQELFIQKSDEIKRYILLILGNILAEDSTYVDYGIKKLLFDRIVELWEDFNGEYTLKLECVFCLEHATYSAKDEEISYLLGKTQILSIFCKALRNFNETDVILGSLTAIHNVYSFEEKDRERNKLKKQFCKRQLEIEGIEKTLEELANHSEKKVSEKAILIVDLLNY